MVNARQNLDLTTFLPPASAAEWRVSEAQVPYPEAIAAMEARVAAIAARQAPELVWLLEHPPLYTSGTSGKPGDPSTYLPCQGPNNPRGTFAYCNALDKDATHYPGYTEPDWFHGGIRPSLFPWLVLPQLGFSFRPSANVAIDLDTGVSISGILTSLGVRFGL